MQADDPPSLLVGTPVSAKYKGAFCEAKVSKVVRIVKCKVTFKMGLGTATLSDEQVRGTLRVGQVVQARHPERREFFDATITKIQDCSQYTVVFDDGDITTLRRTALCLKSGRHFNESETLDQLPLTHPEHFGNPVVGGRRGRRSRQLKEDSSEGEAEEENEPDLELYSADIGRVVSVEASDKKRSKDNWFPGLVVTPSAQPTVKINVKDEFLVRSFKDGRYYTVPKKEVNEFNREMGSKVESGNLAEAVEKALKYLDNDELPVHWERSVLFNQHSQYSDSEENMSDSSNDEAFEEKDHFVAQLYKFMDDAGTPLNKSPTIANRDVDLYRLFKTVEKLGGYNRVTNQSKWRTIAARLKYPNNQSLSNQVKQVYKKCLLTYESFNRTLGVTMLNPSRSSKKNRGRSLIRDRDRATPINSPRPDKDDNEPEKKEDERPKRTETKVKEDDRKKEIVENSDGESSDATDNSEPVSSASRDRTRTKKIEGKFVKVKTAVVEKPKPVEKEEQIKDEEIMSDVGQQTRSKTSATPKTKEVSSPEAKRESKTPTSEGAPKSVTPKANLKNLEEKKRGRKRTITEDKTSHSDSSTTDSSTSTPPVNLGDKLVVYYGASHEQKTYEAKVVEIDKDSNGPVYKVHYTGWNTRYDEWIQPQRIAENLSATTKAKRLKQGTASSKVPVSNKVAGRRGRGASVSGRSTTGEAPRSTTPSSVTSSSSRTKSPATPAARSSGRITRQGDVQRRTRRTSAQTDISLHSDSDTEESESETETELSRTRSGGSRTDSGEARGTRRKTVLAMKSEKRKEKEEEDTEKEDDLEKPKRPRRLKKMSDTKSADDTDEETSLPKGRDFDLNQIRSELKGFVKAVKINSAESSEKEIASSDDSNIVSDTKPGLIEEPEDKKDILDDKSSSDDIYEFKEPEPFEFESRSKLVDDKAGKKRLVARLFEDLEKSPKARIVKSPVKMEPKKPKSEDSEDEEKKPKDAFDKLVESPSFQILKTSDNKQKVTKALDLDEPLSLFKEIDETIEDCDDQLDISDNEESQGEPFFTHDEDIFSESTFAKVTSSESTTLPQECFKDERKKDSDDEDTIRASIQRVIAQTNLSDEESSDDLLRASPITVKKEEKVETTENLTVSTLNIEVKEQVQKQISPALQETDSSLLESICAQPELISTKLEDTKEFNLKTGPKIADSILQKFNMIKNKTETSDKEVKMEETKKPEKPKLKLEPKAKAVPKTSEAKLKSPSPTKTDDGKKRHRKVLSREFVDSDSDSSDSEQLIIDRSDEDSQTDLFAEKPDTKDTDSNLTVLQPEESQSQEEKRNFKFDSEPTTEVEVKMESESSKEEERDSHLHSLLLCEETIPGSPSPLVETSSVVLESKPKKSVLEMPFASAPCSSNSKNISSVSSATVSLNEVKEKRPPQQQQQQQQQFVVEGRDTLNEANTVLDNTPPTTPDSTISNLSPRGENGGLSPNTADNESCKSIDAECDYNRQHTSSSNKLSPYSEEDTLLNSEPSKKEPVAATCKKRRRSCRGSDEVPVKRGRKSNNNRSRHNSDSDDTSEEQSVQGASLMRSSSFDRITRSPRPSKYNFFVDLDPGLDSGQRIALLQQKLSELRKTYADVKAELATIERRRKKIRRREREALKAAKQEVICT